MAVSRQKNLLRAIAVTLCLTLGYVTFFTQGVQAADTGSALDSLGASYDSMYSSDLNNAADSTDTSSVETGPGKSAQQLFEENPHYTMRQYDHKQQVIVGSVVMFCVALAMVAMNNYNPKH